MELDKLKTEIYHEIQAFLKAYQTQDKQTLQERFDIYGDFLDEIYEMLDFVEDLSKLRIFPIEEMHKQISGQDYLDIFAYDESEPTEYGVECVFFEGKEHLGYIIADYHTENHSPKFLFQHFSI